MARLPRFAPSHDRTRSSSASPRQEATCHGRGRRRRRRRSRAGGGIRDRHASSAMRETRPAARRSKLAQRIAPLARGEVAAVRRSPTSRCACPTSPSATPPGNARHLADWRGRTRAAQSVGHLVRALPQGDAGARGARAQARRAGISRWSRSISTPATPRSRKPGSRRSASTGLAYYADPSAKVFQDLKIVGRPLGMPTTLLDRSGRLRDRHGRRPGGMGERGCGEARERGARTIALRPAHDRCICGSCLEPDAMTARRNRVSASMSLTATLLALSSSLSMRRDGRSAVARSPAKCRVRPTFEPMSALAKARPQGRRLPAQLDGAAGRKSRPACSIASDPKARLESIGASRMRDARPPSDLGQRSMRPATDDWHGIRIGMPHCRGREAQRQAVRRLSELRLGLGGRVTDWQGGALEQAAAGRLRASELSSFTPSSPRPT